MLNPKYAIVILILGSALVTVHSTPSKFIPSTEMNPFVVGGQDVTIDEYPFVVVCYNWGSFSCGGSIINEEYVLTAAHCTCDQIQYGVTKREANGPNMVNVAEGIRYPGWTSYVRDDVQLLRLASKIKLSPKAQPVKLPRPGWEVSGSSFETPSAVFGWGYDTAGNLPYTLQRGDYFVINNTDCSRIHSGIASVYDFNCCNGVRGGGVADCNGYIYGINFLLESDS